MRLIPTLFAACTLFASAELPSPSEETKWLGYFVGWENKKFEFGVGSLDGIGNLYLMKGKDRDTHNALKVYFNVEEEIKGKWVRRKLAEEGGLESADAGGIDGKKPVTIAMTVTGGTKAEFMLAAAKGQIVVKPKIVEKKTENPVRISVVVSLPDFYRHYEEDDPKELKKKLKKDLITGVRKADKKKVKAKLYGDDVDLLGSDYFEKGATELTYEVSGMKGHELLIAQGSEEAGLITFEFKDELYKGGRFKWLPDMEKLAEKDSFLSLGVK